MRKTIILSIFLFTSLLSFSQDLIVTKNDKLIYCKITKEDSITVHFRMSSDDLYLDSQIKQSEVENICYNYKKMDAEYSPTAMTIGVLEGGGGLIGANFELLMTKNIGIQIGVGVLSYGGGLTFHIRPDIRSPYFAFEYWHQGFQDSFTQSLMGPSYVWRTKGGFTAQIGLGMLIERNPDWTAGQNYPPLMLTYAIGFYVANK
ncbi:MAG: hypothetical protein PHV20_07640 [Bacteroidales bacterium]|nr:hypothetical protein [Bacteroidales bacterium]